MRVTPALVACSLLLLACASSAPDAGGARPEKFFGVWGWPEGDQSCAENPHEIRFSPDRKLMVLELRDEVTTPDGRDEKAFTYRVLQWSPTLRVALEGEVRRTAEGELVEWEVIGLSPDSYCWHRTDWPAGACTVAILRCES